MADAKISALTPATTPLVGTEVLPIVQSGVTVKVANNDLRPKQIQSNATSGVLQVAGPTAATVRVMTTPDANFTVARTDAGNAFTGNQTVSGLFTAGGAAITGYQHRFTGSTSAFSGANSFGVVVDNTIAPPVGGYTATNTYIAGTLTMPATGALSDASGLWLAAPTLNGTGTAPRATTLRISGAPTGATLNRAVWVQGGLVQFDGGVSLGNSTDKGNGSLNVSGLIYPQQATTAAAPAYVKGAIYFDTTLNKLRVGGATGWETITSA